MADKKFDLGDSISMLHFGSDILKEIFQDKATKEAIAKGLMPKAFGLGSNDEVLFAQLLADLHEPQQQAVSEFLNSLEEEWRQDRFRNIVAAMATKEITHVWDDEKTVIVRDKRGRIQRDDHGDPLEKVIPIKKSVTEKVNYGLAFLVQIAESVMQGNDGIQKAKELCERAGLTRRGLLGKMWHEAKKQQEENQKRPRWKKIFWAK